MVFLILLCFFEVSLIIFLARLFAYFYIIALGLFFSLKALFASLPTQALFGLLGGFLIALSSLDVMLLSDGYLFNICTPTNVGFPLKFGSDVVNLEIISLNILRFLT